MSQRISRLQDIAHKLRINSIRMTEMSKSGHPTSCSSMAEIMSVLFFDVMKYKVKEPLHPSNDRFILSKGHAAPILYAAWSEAGLIEEEKLLSLRKLDSDLEGHPTPRLNFIDVATGSLGQGLAVACGMAYDGKYIETSNYKVYCLMGDGECMEGSVWESASFASYYKLNNLIAIIDINELGQSDYTSLRHDMESYKNRFNSFGFHSIVVDGHCIESLLNGFHEALTILNKPIIILAKTKKGAYFPNIEGKLNWHGKPLGTESIKVIEYIQKLIKEPNIKGYELLSDKNIPLLDLEVKIYPSFTMSIHPNYEKGKDCATRVAGGNALAKIGHDCKDIVVCDADVKNSTYTDKFKNLFPNRFVDCFIAEQQLVGVSIGLSCRFRHIVFLSTFGAFLTRAHDQLRMAAISYSNIKIIGTHCGISIGEDGGSQMGLEDISMFRSLPDCIILYPSDAVSAERSIELAGNIPKMFYIRMSRPSLETIYSNNEIFEIGRSKIIHKSDNDKILVIGACVTLIESIKAYNILKLKGINIRIMDIFSIKPIDIDSIIINAADCENRILTVEDHYYEGGIGEAVSGCISKYGKFSVNSIYVNNLPHSGKPEELLDLFGLTSKHIIDKIYQIIQ